MTSSILDLGGQQIRFIDLARLLGADLARLPWSMRILIENVVRHAGAEARAPFIDWLGPRRSEAEIAFHPGRLLMHDTTCVPALVDIAAMRDAVAEAGGDPAALNPVLPVDVSVDHSMAVDRYGTADALAHNMGREIERNAERYRLMKWAAATLRGVTVHPPGTGIMHTMNLEQLSSVVALAGRQGETWAVPDTLIGTDSHTPMVNGIGVLGWGVGGVEAESVMFGMPVMLRIPDITGVRLTGALRDGVLSTDLALTVTECLRRHGLSGEFVEFFGPGVSALSAGDRAVVANMAPEFGGSTGYFPIDERTLRYLADTGRPASLLHRVEAVARRQGLWFDPQAVPVYTDVVEIDLGDIATSLAGPRRPQDRLAPAAVPQALAQAQGRALRPDLARDGLTPPDGAVAIAAITSCTNTSNPSVMMGAGLLARKAAAKGLTVKPWVKTSLAPGSQVVAEYLNKSGLQTDLDKLGFNLVAFGCTTCIGNSGPLAPEISKTINDHDLVNAAVLSGNRNFEARVNPDVRANYLASPPLVVAYALAGSMQVDLNRSPLGTDKAGKKVFLKDIWPSNREIATFVRKNITKQMFTKKYADVFKGDALWRKISVKGALTYAWDSKSTYVQNPPYFVGMSRSPATVTDIVDARVLGLFLDSITTDHISPAGSIKLDSPAGKYLTDHKVKQADFNQYGTRRGNHEVMMRGTFANIRLKNQMVPGVEGGVTVHFPSRQRMSIFDAAMRYKNDKVPLVIFAGKEYGSGSSRDWAAKGPNLLGVRAVVTQSFERIHRSNLIGMGVLPLCFEEGTSWQSLGLKGDEQVTIRGLHGELKPRQRLVAEIVASDGGLRRIPLICRIDTLDELDYFKHGGILQYVLRQLVSA